MCPTAATPTPTSLPIMTSIPSNGPNASVLKDVLIPVIGAILVILAVFCYYSWKNRQPKHAVVRNDPPTDLHIRSSQPPPRLVTSHRIIIPERISSLTSRDSSQTDVEEVLREANGPLVRDHGHILRPPSFGIMENHSSSNQPRTGQPLRPLRNDLYTRGNWSAVFIPTEVPMRGEGRGRGGREEVRWSECEMTLRDSILDG